MICMVYRETAYVKGTFLLMDIKWSLFSINSKQNKILNPRQSYMTSIEPILIRKNDFESLMSLLYLHRSTF